MFVSGTAQGTIADGHDIRTVVILRIGEGGANSDPIGAYTAILRGNGTGLGIGLIEVYDLNTAASKLANPRTRALVLTDGNVVIAGFILGNNGGNDRLIVRREWRRGCRHR